MSLVEGDEVGDAVNGKNLPFVVTEVADNGELCRVGAVYEIMLVVDNSSTGAEICSFETEDLRLTISPSFLPRLDKVFVRTIFLTLL